MRKNLWEISLFVEAIILQYVLGHVGLIGNELADEAAERAKVHFSIAEQDKVCCTLSNLKCYLSNYQSQSLRQQILPDKPSNLNLRLLLQDHFRLCTPDIELIEWRGQEVTQESCGKLTTLPVDFVAILVNQSITCYVPVQEQRSPDKIMIFRFTP